MKNRFIVSLTFVLLMVFVSFDVSCSKGDVPKNTSTSVNQASEARDLSEGIVARVNGRVITMESLQKEMHMGPLNIESGKMPTSEETARIKKDALDLLILMELASEYGEKNFKVSDDEVEESVSQLKAGLKTEQAYVDYLKGSNLTDETLRKEISRRLTIGKAFQQEVNSKVLFDEEDARREYDSRKEDFTLAERIEVEIIQVYAGHGREEAGMMAEDLAAQLREAKSTSVLKDKTGIFIVTSSISSNENPDLFGMVSGLNPSDVSDIFEKDDYYQFMLVKNKLPEEIIPFDKAKELLMQDAMAERAREWYEELKKGAEIEILLK